MLDRRCSYVLERIQDAESDVGKVWGVLPTARAFGLQL